jgi:hypothetical protein
MGGYYNMEAMDRNGIKAQQVTGIKAILKNYEKAKHNTFATDTKNFEELVTNSLKPIKQKSKSSMRGSSYSKLGGSMTQSMSNMQNTIRTQVTNGSSESNRNRRTL